MVRDQGPGVALGLGLFEDVCQPLEEGLAVLVVAEELSSFDSPGHDVLEEAWGVKSWLAWHGLSFWRVSLHNDKGSAVDSCYAV